MGFFKNLNKKPTSYIHYPLWRIFLKCNFVPKLYHLMVLRSLPTLSSLHSLAFLTLYLKKKKSLFNKDLSYVIVIWLSAWAHKMHPEAFLSTLSYTFVW